MKKFNILATLAAFAMLLTSFTGCVTENPDSDIKMLPGYIAGGFTNYVKDAKAVGTNYFVPITYDENDVGKVTFTYDSTKEGWAQAKGTIAFKFTYASDWSTQWGDVKTAVGEDYVAAVVGSKDNCVITGLVDGKDYTILCKVEKTTVSVKVESSWSAPVIYSVDSTGLNKLDFEAEKYTKTFTASGSEEAITLFTDGQYFKGSAKFEKDAKAGDLILSETPETVRISGLTAGDRYLITLTYDSEAETPKGTVLVSEALPVLYLAGAAPLNWDLTKENAAITANLVGKKTTVFYYTFEAVASSMDFKVATKGDWDFAWSNCKSEDGETLTILDAEPVEFSNANAKNARISNLTPKEKYTIIAWRDSADDKAPKVSVVSGEDILFAIGNEDFGNWTWDNPITMTPVANGEWKYEFEATNANAEFKFQTVCGTWVDSATWNAKKSLVLGADYVVMEQGAGGDNMSATLEVGKSYILSVKKINDAYNVKIAAK